MDRTIQTSSKNYQIEIKGNTLEISVGKELDHHMADAIRMETDSLFRRPEVKNVVFDFNHTEFMDSSGIGVIMGRYKIINGIGGNVYVKNVTGNVARIMEISGLYKIVKVISNTNPT